LIICDSIESWLQAPHLVYPPWTPLAAVATRAAALVADKDAVEHVMNVLTFTLWSASTKAKPYHLIRDHVAIDKTLDFFTLDEVSYLEISRCLGMLTITLPKLM
jgi:hypothetical protein